MKYSGDGERMIRVNFGGEFGAAYFVPRCPICGRFVTTDEKIAVNGLGEIRTPNATCQAHGRVAMPFEGWIED